MRRDLGTLNDFCILSILSGRLGLGRRYQRSSGVPYQRSIAIQLAKKLRTVENVYEATSNSVEAGAVEGQGFDRQVG